MGIERRFPLSQDSFHLCEDFLRVEVPGRLAFRATRVALETHGLPSVRSS